MNKFEEMNSFFSKLTDVQNKLAEAEGKIEAFEAKKKKRTEAMKKHRKEVSLEEREFSEILRFSMARLKGQEFNDSLTLNQIIKKRIAKGQCGEHSFFSIFKSRVERLKDLSSFSSECENENLDADAVAQHIVARGEKTMNLVFKKGLVSAIGKNKLSLMGKRIFTDEELTLSRYEPESHPDLAQAADSANADE